MKKYEEDKAVIKNENNEEIVIYKLLAFKSTKTNKEYLVYTKEDDSDNLFASILISDGKDLKLEKIVEEVDREEVRKALLKAQITNAVQEEII